MNISYEDFGFPADFQTSSNNLAVSTVSDKLEKQRRAILIVKQKIAATDTVIKKYYGMKKMLNEAEKAIVVSKEECKNVCIDHRKTLTRCAELENNTKMLEYDNQQLQNKCNNVENQFGAFQSHAKQLQILVKDHEIAIEELKKENLLEKSKSKNLQKQNSVLTKHISLIKDVLMGKKKLTKEHKLILQKYGKTTESINPEDSIGEDNISDDEDFDSIPISPLGIHSEHEMIPKNGLDLPDEDIKQRKSLSRKDEIDRDFDYNNEVVSIDTGRGSSLAFSPEYFINDSPLSTEIHKIIDKRKQIDVATSPIMFDDPTSFDDVKPKQMVCRAVSPIKIKVNIDASTSPIRKQFSETATSPLKLFEDKSKKINANKKITIIEDTQIKPARNECQQPINIDGEDSTDSEIQMIFDTMRLRQKLVTPLPSTPSKLRQKGMKHHSKPLENISEHPAVTCPDVAKMREENKNLQEQVSDLAKEIMNIKVVLNMQPIINEKTHTEINVLSQDLFNDDSNDIPLINYKNGHPVSSIKEATEDISTQDLIQTHVEIQPENCGDKVNNSSSAVNTLCFEDPLLSPTKSIENNGSGRNSNIFEDEMDANEIEEDIIRIGNPKNNSGSNNDDPKQKTKPKKLTRLEKFRKKLLPKSKIKSVNNPCAKKTLFKSKQILNTVSKKKATKSDTSASLNDKVVYEKALKVMSELKSKQKQKTQKTSITTRSRSKVVKANVASKIDKKEINKKDSKQKESVVHGTTEVEIDKHSQEPTVTQVVPVSDCTVQNKNLVKNNCIREARVSIEKLDISGILDSGSRRTRPRFMSVGSIDILDKSGKTNINQNNKMRLRLISLGNLEPQDKSPFCSKIQNGINVSTEQVEKQPKTSSLQPMDKLDNLPVSHNGSNEKVNEFTVMTRSRKRPKNLSEETPEIHYKKMLRSSNVQTPTDTNHPMINKQPENCEIVENNNNKTLKSPKSSDIYNNNKVVNNNNNKLLTSDILAQLESTSESQHNTNDIESPTMREKGKNIVDYNDLDVFADLDVTTLATDPKENKEAPESTQYKESVLCRMLEKYGVNCVRTQAKKVPDVTTNAIFAIINDGIANVVDLSPTEAKDAMNEIADEIRKYKMNEFLSGLMKYLGAPERKVELFNIVTLPPAPPMTKSEQVLLYIITQLGKYWQTPVLLNNILNCIDYALFQLNRTPEFQVIETMSHFYAILCRYFRAKNRLRTFILDAMYCIQFKAVPLIKQCLDVWAHILPLAHMGIAKTPLVTCLIYLLHFYKCEDRHNRVQEIRNIISRKYYYVATEWNETKILDLFKTSIKNVRDVPVERKMLRLALIILCKRQGPQWCQKNIVKNMLQPIIENANVSETVKTFCVAMIGPLMKPYPIKMKINCEIALNELLNMLEKKPSRNMQQAIFTSLVYLSRHNKMRVTQALLSWKTECVSAELEEILRDFVREKPVYLWKKILSKHAPD